MAAHSTARSAFSEPSTPRTMRCTSGLFWPGSVTDDEHRARCMRGQVLAYRTEQHAGEFPVAVATDDYETRVLCFVHEHNSRGTLDSTHGDLDRLLRRGFG